MNELIEMLLELGPQIAGIAELADQLNDLAGVVDNVRGSFEKTWAAIETGARLQGLSSATGESVGKLYEFERGLEAVGRKARYVPTVFADMQRALSGTGESSDRAEYAFARLHLNIDQLRKEDTADAIMHVAGALRKLDPNQAAGLADEVFGKFQGQTVLAIARNMDLFQREMKESTQTGAWFEQNSQSFEQIMADRGNIKDLFTGNMARLIGIHFGNPDAHASNAQNIQAVANHFKPEFTSLEKMGFIMSGAKVQNPYDQRKIDLLQQIRDAIAGLHPQAPNPIMQPQGHTI